MSETPEQGGGACERCGQRPASVRIRKVAEGREEDLHVCPECAGELGIQPSAGEDPSMLSDPVTLMFQSMEETSGSGAVCRGCGITYDRFRETGRLGCALCYETFADELGRLLRRIHGKDRHAGRTPLREGGGQEEAARIRRLSEELERAVSAEDYERAAELRDRLRETEPTRGRGREEN